jgi:NAD-dependent DNA ligase
MVKVIRSGEIIPKIIEVLKPSKLLPPSKKEFGEYGWDENKVNLVLVDRHAHAGSKVETLKRMFKHLDMDFCGPGLGKLLVDAGVDTPAAVLNLSLKKLQSLKLEGVGISKEKKLIEAIEKVRNGSVGIDRLAVASGFFDKGIGTTRMRLLADTYPQLLKSEAWSKVSGQWRESVELIKTTKGLGPAFARSFSTHALQFCKWLESSGIQVAATPKKKKVVKGELTGVLVSFTGYRSADQEQEIEGEGGEVVPFGSKTMVLLYDPNGKASSKVDKARDKGIKVMTWSEFTKKYL